MEGLRQAVNAVIAQLAAGIPFDLGIGTAHWLTGRDTIGYTHTRYGGPRTIGCVCPTHIALRLYAL